MLRRLPLAPTLTLSLLGLTLVLALVAALGIGNLYEARQDYEDALARTYELESASSRLLAAGVIEETSFRERGAGARAARRRAASAFDAVAAQALSLARTDPEQRAARARAAHRRAPRAAPGGPHPGRRPRSGRGTPARASRSSSRGRPART